MKLKHSIGQLILAVLACGVAVRAITSPSRLWEAVILSSALTACSLALVGALYARRHRRPYFGGAAACGWIYLLLALGPWFSDRVGPYLATGAAIDFLFNAMKGGDQQRAMTKLLKVREELASTQRRIAKTARNVQSDPAMQKVNAEMRSLENKLVGLGASVRDAEVEKLVDPDDRWAVWIRPDWSRLDGVPVTASIPFQRIGHGLFAIAFALAGGAFGRFIAGRGAADGAGDGLMLRRTYSGHQIDGKSELARAKP